MGIFTQYSQCIHTGRISLSVVVVFGIITLIENYTEISNTDFSFKRPLNTDFTSNATEHTRSYLQENKFNRSLSMLKELRRKYELPTAPTNPPNCTEDFRKRHLMTVGFTGRTGNHLFHLASLLAVTALTCYKPVRTPKALSIDHIFDLQNIETFNETESFKNILEPGWMKYDPNITLKVKPKFNWTLKGCRQSYRYFQNHAELVRSSFRFKRNIRRDVVAYMESKIPKGSPRVGIHVRRGDMANISPKVGHVSAGIDFINRSIDYMENYLKPSNFSLIVVSDNINWCEQHIKGDNIYFSPFNNVGRDLYLLTQCDHHIVTSGTFGWMGAWLNETGLVIYNKMYPFPNSRLAKGYKKEDYYPNHWVEL